MDALRACLPEDLLKVEAEKEQGAESKKRKRQQWDNNGREAAVSADRNSRHCGSKHRVHNPDVSPSGRGQLAAAGTQQVCTQTHNGPREEIGGMAQGRRLHAQGLIGCRDKSARTPIAR